MLWSCVVYVMSCQASPVMLDMHVSRSYVALVCSLNAVLVVLLLLLVQIDSSVVAPRVADFMPALLMCCKDMAWPVRDAGCTAAGR